MTVVLWICANGHLALRRHFGVLIVRHDNLYNSSVTVTQGWRPEAGSRDIAWEERKVDVATLKDHRP